MVKTEEILRFEENLENSGNRINFRKLNISYLRRKLHPFFKVRKPDKFLEKKIIISHMRSKPSILWRNLKIWWKSGKIRGKKFGNRMNFLKSKSSYHIWILNHSFCQEICLKLMRYEDLRSAPSKKKTQKNMRF